MSLHATLLALLCPAIPDASEVHLPRRAGEVVVVEHRGATETFSPQPRPIEFMFSAGLRRLTGKPSTREAWASLVSTNDIIGLKIHSAPGHTSGTRPAVVAAAIESLLQAGIASSNLVLWDRRLSDLKSAGFVALAERYGIRAAGSLEAGYDPEAAYETPLLGRLVHGDLEFGRTGEDVGRKSHLSRLVSRQLTRIINITPLLNHNVAGVSGVLHGLTLGSIDNSLRFELDPVRLATAIPEIFAMPQLADRVAINIVDALICQYEGEERSLLHYSTDLNQLWFSFDPVAADVLADQGVHNVDGDTVGQCFASGCL